MTMLQTLIERFRYGKHLEPEKDWFVLLLAALAILIISLAWNLWLFTQVKDGTLIGTGSAPAPIFTANARSLQMVQDAFSSRASEEAKYETGGYTFVDPAP